jgi:hypothetical protein
MLLSTCGDFKTHIFTGPGTFCVSATAVTAACNTVDYLVVAGGGAGAASSSGRPVVVQVVLECQMIYVWQLQQLHL